MSVFEKPVIKIRIICARLVVSLALNFAYIGIAGADTFVSPPRDISVIGSMRVVIGGEGELLVDIARSHDLGQEEILIANPELSRWIPVSGKKILLPTRFILPAGARDGIVVNLPEMRLYWFVTDEGGNAKLVFTHPVSIGQVDWTTPIGTSRIVSRLENPPWFPPLSIKQEAELRGTSLPDVVPPGKDNPLGQYALYLDLPGYLIHGTNNPWAIGLRVTHGCIRLYPQDVANLFRHVPDDAPVRLINAPVKVGWSAGNLWLEVHPPLIESAISDDALLDIALQLIEEAVVDQPARVYPQIIRLAVERRDGVPVSLGTPMPEKFR